MCLTEEECVANLLPRSERSERLRKILLAVLAASICGPVFVLLMDAAFGAEPQSYNESAGEVAADGHDAITLCAIVNGLSYSQRHRSGTVEASLHCPKGWESDHEVPIADGGADAVKNLWCQPPDALAPDGLGHESKDRLEKWSWRQLCRHGRPTGADPAAIQAIFLAPHNWREDYRQHCSAGKCR